jgi:hypothetical protein
MMVGDSEGSTEDRKLPAGERLLRSFYPLSPPSSRRFQNRLLFPALVGILLAQPHYGAWRLDVETAALGLRVHVTEVIGNRLFFLPPGTN